MTDPGGNVVVLPTAARAGRRQPARLEALRVTVGQLDELSDRLQRISPRSDWPAKAWIIAATPLRMRLASIRSGLNDLGTMDPLAEPNTVRWMLDLSYARSRAGQQLDAIMACLHVLQCTDASPAERAREAEIFAFSRSELLTALQEVRHLIAGRFPAVFGEH